eukprot:1800403-Rhodomonas_salina.1
MLRQYRTPRRMIAERASGDNGQRARRVIGELWYQGNAFEDADGADNERKVGRDPEGELKRDQRLVSHVTPPQDVGHGIAKGVAQQRHCIEDPSQQYRTLHRTLWSSTGHGVGPYVVCGTGQCVGAG